MVGIIQRLSDAGIALVSLREHEVDMTSPWGELVVAIFAYVAAVESRQISGTNESWTCACPCPGQEARASKGEQDKEEEEVKTDNATIIGPNVYA